MRIENLLRSAGVKEDLLYKPDIFSTLGIYRNNIWGFRPTIFSSKVTNTEEMSRITVAGTGGGTYLFVKIKLCSRQVLHQLQSRAKS